MRRIHALAATAALILASPIASPQAETPAHPDEIAAPPLEPFQPPQPETADLAGGARLLLIEDHELPLVDGRLLFRCGSIQDPAGKAGLAVLLADVLRSGGGGGTTGEELDAWLSSRGADLSIQATSDQLVVEFSCLSEDLEALLAKVGGLLAQPAYPDAELERSRARLLTEIERRDDDTSALADRVLLQLIYGTSSPYSRVETPKSVASITRDDLVAYHAAHVGTDRLFAGAYGDASMSKLRGLVEGAFADLPQVGPAPEVPAPSFVQPQSTKVFVYDRPGVPQSELRISAPGTRRMHDSYSALNLWSYVVGIGGMTNRMMVKVRTELGLAYSVGAYYRPEWERSGRLEAFCSTRNDGLADAAEAMIAILRGGLQAIPEDELQATRDRALNAEVFRVDTPQKVLTRALELAFHGYPADFYEQHALELRDLGADQLIAAAQRQLDPGRLVVLAVGPYDEIAESLERIGPVERVELGAPETGTKPADPAPLLDRMFASIGGRERWAAASFLDYEATVELPGNSISVRMQRDLDAPRMRFTNMFDGGSQTYIVNERGAWLVLENQYTPLETELHRRLLDSAHYDLFALLHGLAKGMQVGASPDGALVILEGAALGTRIELDVAGRPTRLVAATADPLAYTFQGWTEGDALDAPARIVKEQDGQPGTARQMGRILTPKELAPELFEPPGED